MRSRPRESELASLLNEDLLLGFRSIPSGEFEHIHRERDAVRGCLLWPCGQLYHLANGRTILRSCDSASSGSPIPLARGSLEEDRLYRMASRHRRMRGGASARLRDGPRQLSPNGCGNSHRRVLDGFPNRLDSLGSTRLLHDLWSPSTRSRPGDACQENRVVRCKDALGPRHLWLCILHPRTCGRSPSA